MELKKVIIIEIAVVIIALFVVVVFVGLSPYLASSKQNSSIGLYNEKIYAEGNLTLIRGKTVQSTIFNYTTFDPAIVVVEMDFKTWQSQGNLTLSINDIAFATVHPTAENPKITVNTVSFSGIDLVKPNLIYSRFFSNSVYFSSKAGEGYAGSFSYQISVRGSR